MASKAKESKIDVQDTRRQGCGQANLYSQFFYGCEVLGCEMSEAQKVPDEQEVLMSKRCQTSKRC